jgi:hypothetical protein
MELKSYVCPNCGANTTNAENCEYCGSLLVRFVEKGIDLSQTSYTDNSEVFPGLIAELKKNLKLQDANPKDFVSTAIAWISPQYNEDYDSITITPDDDGGENPIKGLYISFIFDTYADNLPEFETFNKQADIEIALFKQLISFPLFTSDYGSYVDSEGYKRIKRSFDICFGEDVEGAARLISEVLIKVKGLKSTDNYDIFTNVGFDACLEAKNAWLETHGVAVNTSDANNSGCAGVFLAGIILAGTAIAALL